MVRSTENNKGQRRSLRGRLFAPPRDCAERGSRSSRDDYYGVQWE